MRRQMMVLAMLTACGGGGISEDPASGTIEGADWTLVTGAARVDADGDLSVDLYGEAVEDPCGFVDAVEPVVTFFAPNAVGEYELNLNLFELSGQTVTLFVPSTGSNVILTDGVVEFTSIGDTSVQGGLNVGNGDDEVNGTFDIVLCAEPA